MVLSWIWLWMWDKIAKPSARSRSSSCFQSIRALYPICSGLHDSDNDQKKEERHHESRRTLVLTSQFSHNRPLWISLIFASGEGYMYYLFWYMYSVMPHYFPNHLSVHNVERPLIAYLILKKSSRWNWQRAQIQVTRRMSNMATCYMYMSHSLLAYLILAIRRARLDQRRPATYLIMSRNCARITPGGPIEPENFDRRKRREHGDVVVTYIHSLDYCDKSWNTPCYPADTSSHHRHRRHEIAMSLRLNSISPCLTCAGLLDSEHFAGFTGSTWLARISSESSMLYMLI